MNDTWYQSVWLLLKNMFFRVEDADIPYKLKGLSVKYLYALVFIFSVALIPSLLFLAIGYAYEARWLILIGGVWQAFWLWPIAAALSPLGIMHQIFKGGYSGSVDRYLKTIRWCFISKLFFTFVLLLLLPWIKNNANALPLFIAGALVLGFVTERIASEKFIRYSTMAAMFCIALSFFFPNIPEFASAKISGLNQDINKPELLQFTWDKWSAGEVELYNQDGSVKAWYVVAPDRKYKLFKTKGRGRDTVYNKELMPMTDEVREIISMNKERLFPGNLLDHKSAVVSPSSPSSSSYPVPQAPAASQPTPAPVPIDRSVVPDQPKPEIIPPTSPTPETPPKPEPPTEPVKRYKYATLVVGSSGRSENKSSREVASWFGAEGTSGSKVLPNATFSEKKLSEADRMKLESIAENIVVLRYSIEPSQSRLASVHYTCKMEARIIDAKTGDTIKVVRKEFGSSGLTEESAKRASKKTVLESIKNELMQ